MNTREYVPATVEVPLSTPLEVLNVIPLGSAPVTESWGRGKPVTVTVNDPIRPTGNVVLATLVIAGAVTDVSKKFCVSFGRTPFWTEKVIGKIPPMVGLPARTPVNVLNVTPVGNAPVSVKVGAGKPLAVTVNVLDAPAVNVALSALVISGARLVVAK